MKRREWILLGAAVVIGVVASWRISQLDLHSRRGRETVASRLAQYGPGARARLVPFFQAAGVAYPPRYVVLLGLKQERRLEVYAGSEPRSVRFVRAYPILGASGRLGPKLREGDGQVPEGIYEVESLHPNSAYHLALRVGYPNAFDRTKAKADGRTEPGTDIMIHGGASSIGCLAMGDPASEDLFVLAAETGRENVEIVLAPLDFRRAATPPASLPSTPPWVLELYAALRKRVERLPLPGP